jgi:hypothetical protein
VPRAPRNQTPTDAINQAAKDAPAGKYARVALGVVAVVGSISLWGLSAQVAVFGTVLVVILMVVLTVVTKIITLPAKSTRGVAHFLQWSSAILFVLVPATLYSSVFWGFPRDLAFFIDPSLRRRSLPETELYVPYPPLHDDQNAFVKHANDNLGKSSWSQFADASNRHNVNGKGWTGTVVETIRENGAEGVVIDLEPTAKPALAGKSVKPAKKLKPVRARCYLKDDKLADLGPIKIGDSVVTLDKAWLEEVTQDGEIDPIAKARFSHCEVRVIGSRSDDKSTSL